MSKELHLKQMIMIFSFFFIHILYENSFFLQLLSIPVEQSKTEVVTDVLIPGISDIPFIEDEMTDSDG